MIDPKDPDAAQMLADLRKTVMRLSYVSHAPTQSYDVVLKGDDVPATPERWRVNDRREPWPHMGSHASGKSGDTAVPRGGIDHFGDFQVNYRQKSHVYFQHKLNRLFADRKATLDQLLALTLEAEDTLGCWLRTPAYSGAEPVLRDSFQWKCLIADHPKQWAISDQDVREINRLYGMGKTIPRSTIFRYRDRYRGLRKSSTAR